MHTCPVAAFGRVRRSSRGGRHRTLGPCAPLLSSRNQQKKSSLMSAHHWEIEKPAGCENALLVQAEGRVLDQRRATSKSWASALNDARADPLNQRLKRVRPHRHSGLHCLLSGRIRPVRAAVACAIARVGPARRA